MLMYGSNFCFVTRNPDAFSNLASDAAVMPFPSPDTTPPVTKIYLTSATLVASPNNLCKTFVNFTKSLYYFNAYFEICQAFCKNNLQIRKFCAIIIKAILLRLQFLEKVPSFSKLFQKNRIF